MSAYLNAVAGAVPTHDIHEAYIDWARDRLPDARRQRLFDRMTKRAEIGHRWSVLPESDHRQLRRHLRRCERDRQTATELLSYVLRHKILATSPVRNVRADDLVTGGCHVVYSIDGGPVRNGRLLHRAGSATASDVIPVFSLLGATLIGIRIGQRAPLLKEDGPIGTVAVQGVTRPS